MIFLGDIACPRIIHLDIEKLHKVFAGKPIVANLEGPVVFNKTSENLRKNILFNNEKIIEQLQKLNVKVLSLANNHILDLGFDGLNSTLDTLNKGNIKSVGAGTSLMKASKPVSIDNEKYILLGFGWEVIQCQIAGKKSAGVNPLKVSHILNSIKEAKKMFPESYLILLFHWNYELELYPQPQERQLARLCIDNGACAVIGCHSHLVQGIEIYKECPIVYGLGNWFIPHNTFFSGRLCFPREAYRQLALEWVPSNEPVCHWFHYNPDNHELKYTGSVLLSKSKKMKELTPFSNLTHKDYISWFRKNRRKKILLPVFKDINHTTYNFYKANFIKLRDRLIDALLKLRLKKIRSGLK